MEPTPGSAVWQGPGGSVVGEALEPLSRSLRGLEGDVVDLSQAWQRWRDGLAERRAGTAELAEAMAVDARRRRPARGKSAEATPTCGSSGRGPTWWPWLWPRSRSPLAVPVPGEPVVAVIAVTTASARERNTYRRVALGVASSLRLA